MKSLLLFSLLLFTLCSHAQPGTIDKSYGEDNIGTVSIVELFTPTSSVIQPDDKLLLGGYTLYDSSYFNYTLRRHNKDGSLDTSFGNGGQSIITIDDLVRDIRSTTGCESVAVMPDGKIVATGGVAWYNPDLDPDPLDPDEDVVVTRFLPDGTPDGSFGNGGRVVTTLGGFERPTAIAVQADGKVLVTGFQVEKDNGNGLNAFLLRYNQDGSPDGSFGNGKGYVTYTNVQAYALLVQPDGKIVTGGSLSNENSFIVLRYLPDGTPDAGFGNKGVVTTSFGANLANNAQINNLALDEKQRIVAAGVTDYQNSNEVVRYLPDGSPDNSFGKNGVVKVVFTNIDRVYGTRAIVQPGNKLVLSALVSGEQTGSLFVPALTALNEDGSTDESFGTDNGQTIVNTVPGQEFISAVMQKDGKIVLACDHYDDFTAVNTYLLLRFNGYPTQVPLLVRIKRFLHNHGISWKGLPAEDKVAYYSVEQSSSKSSGFTPVAKVSGRANLKDYTISNDRLLEGTNYYRIKAVSADGTIRYSEVAAADNPTASASIYPNPAKGNITIGGLKSNETANIAIKDAAGTVLSKGTSSGSTQYNTQVGSLKPGTYYLNITTKEKTEVVPFVKE